MQKTISHDYTKLAQERLQLKQTLYKKLLLYIMSTNVVLVILEMLQAAYSNKMDTFFTFTFLLIFIFVISTIILHMKDRQEMAITIFIGLYYLFGLIACYHGKAGYLDNPMDSFYLSYALALFERLVIARIPTSLYKIVFSICTTAIRILVIPSNNKEIFTIQIVYVFFGIYLDLDKGKHDKNIIESYFNSKNQLEKFKNLVVNDIPDSIAIISQDLSQCLFANKSFSALCDTRLGHDIQAHLNQFKVQEEENQAQTINSISTNPPRKTLLSFLENTMTHSDFLADKKFSCNLTYSEDLDITVQRELSNNRIFESKVFHIVWDEIPAVAILLHDITQQHTIIGLKIADAHKDSLLATVSHELRTPLNGMLGMIQILQKRNKDPESVKYLNICKNSGNLLMGLVNSILDFNQIRANKFKLSPENINLYELLRDMVQLFELQCAQKGIYIKLNISPSAQKFIITDQNRLSQIFINLIGNALKFTMRGGITISARESLNRRFLELAVHDTGIGIKEADKGKLFKLFGKLESKSCRANQQGVGLGLTISDNIARLLCGDDDQAGIKLESVYGEGSVFSFAIKTNLAEDTSTQESDDSMLSCHNESIHISEKMKGYVLQTENAPSFTRRKPISDGMIPLADFRRNVSNFLESPQRPTNRLSRISDFKSEDHIRALNLHQLKLSICVLIVDDNPFNITVAEYLVNSHGYKVKTALDGQTAIDIVLKSKDNAEPIKLILMDCQMPIMDGYETTRALRKLMSQKKIPEIPIVALTANNTEADKEASKKSGMCEHLTKPLKEAELFKVLSKYVSNHVST